MTSAEKGASAKPRAWKKVLTSVVIILGALAILTAIVIWLSHASTGKIIGYFVLLAVLSAVGVLNAYFPVVERMFLTLVAGYFRFLVWMLLTLGPLAFFNWLSQLVLNRLTLGFQLAVFVVYAMLLAFAVWLVATERNRERLFSSLQKKVGHFTPIAYSLNLLMIAVMFFASVTYVLVQHTTLRLNPAAAAGVSQGSIADFYFWHFLKAIPLLEVTETLHWKEPLTYDSGWVGLLLLLFKVAVIVPVIAAFAWYWKQVVGEADKK